MKHVNIPDHWTAEQALTTVAFLERLIDAIWRAHGPDMAAELAAPRPRPRPARPRRLPPPIVARRLRRTDDDLPF